MERLKTLSAYEIMWMIVLFDLPVVEPEDRKAASQFRGDLLKMGFSMSQYSVYYKMMSGKERAERFRSLVHKALPANGRVDVVLITDKQYANIDTYTGRERIRRKNRDQLVLF